MEEWCHGGNTECWISSDGRELRAVVAFQDPAKGNRLGYWHFGNWDTSTWEMRWEAQRARGDPAVWDFQIAPDGRKLAAFPGATDVEIEDFDTGKQIATLRLPDSNAHGPCHGHWIDDRTLLVGGPDPALWLWDIAKPTAMPIPSSDYEPGACSSADGRLLATGLRDMVNMNGWILHLPTALQPAVSWCFGAPHVVQPSPIMIRDIPSGRLVGQTRLERGWVHSMALSPDRLTLAVTDNEGRVLLYDVPRTGK